MFSNKEKLKYLRKMGSKNQQDFTSHLNDEFWFYLFLLTYGPMSINHFAQNDSLEQLPLV